MYSSQAMSALVQKMAEVGVPFMTELMFVVFFAVSFAFLRVRTPAAHSKNSGTYSTAQNPLSSQAIEKDFQAGDMNAVLRTWRLTSFDHPTHSDILRLVARAMVAVEPERLIPEIIEHLEYHGGDFAAIVRTATETLEAVAQSPDGADLAEELMNSFEARLGLRRTVYTKESLLGGHAMAGNDIAVSGLLGDLEASNHTISARCQTALIRGFQMHGKLDAALDQMLAMVSLRRKVAGSSVLELLRMADAAGRTQEVLKRMEGNLPLTPDTVTFVLQSCLKTSNLVLAMFVEDMARQDNVTLTGSSYDALLKIYADAGDDRAFLRFDEMVKVDLRISDGLCVGLISRCATSKFRSFAERIFDFLRARGELRLNMFSAMMKVYACDGLYDKACALYSEVIAQGLEPDSVMYACLIKFASESGKVDLLSTLSEKAQDLDVHHFTHLIRACGQAKDVDKAFAIFRQLQQSGKDTNAVAYNVLLDVCVSAGRMDRARSIFKEMPEHMADEITYNVLLKGYCAARDIDSAAAVVREMEKKGRKPSSTAYNCFLNMAVAMGSADTIWRTIAAMDERSVPVDRYTVATLMKAIKHSREPQLDLDRTLVLLDRSGVDICGDDVLLVTVLEACIKHRNFQRIERIVDQFWSSASANRAMMHTHALMIKASGMLGRVDRCWELWRILVFQRMREPSSIVIGCMLDALVNNRCVNDAIDLLHDVKSRGFQTNAVMYSTIMKGFSAENNTEAAVLLFQEMRDDGLKPTTATFNSIIDVHARVGATKKVMVLLDQMKVDGCDIDEVTLSIVVKSFCVAGDVDTALQVFYERCKANNMSCTSAYNTLLDRCIQADRPDLSTPLVEDMDSFHVRPTNFTLGSHIKHYGRCKRLDLALDAVETWPAKYGVHPGLVAKTCLIRTCFGCGSTDLGLKILKEMQQSGEKLDSRALRSLVSGCLSCNRFHEAVVLVEGEFGITSEDNLRPAKQNSIDVDILEKLIQALLRHGHRLTMARPLMQKIIRAGYQLNTGLVMQVMNNNSRGF